MLHVHWFSIIKLKISQQIKMMVIYNVLLKDNVKNRFHLFGTRLFQIQPRNWVISFHLFSWSNQIKYVFSMHNLFLSTKKFSLVHLSNKIVKMITSIARTLSDEKFRLAIQHSGAFGAFVLLNIFPLKINLLYLWILYLRDDYLSITTSIQLAYMHA